MQFNPVNGNVQTNYEAMKDKLYAVFPKEFVDEMKFVWWNVTERLSDFPSQISDGGTYMLGGLDGAVISLLLGEEVEKKEKPKMSMIDLVNEALNQEILTMVEI